MFPITITFTVNNDAELAKFGALTSALATPATVQEKPAPVEKPAAPKAPKAAPAPAAETASEKQAPAATVSVPAATASDTPAVDFDTLKKAFLALSTKEGGRAKCESVLKPFGLAKLSEAKSEQYADVLAAIGKASA